MRFATCHPEEKHYAHDLCLPCYGKTRNNYLIGYYQKNKKKIIERSKENHLANRPKRLLQAKARYRDPKMFKNIILCRVKSRAVKKDVPFNLNVKDLILPEFCPILGIKMKRNSGNSAGPDSYSIDRIIPEKGYTKENIQVISYRANMMKSDATKQELLEFAKWINKNYMHEDGATID